MAKEVKKEQVKKGDFAPIFTEGKCTSWNDPKRTGICDRSFIEERCQKCPKNGE